MGVEFLRDKRLQHRKAWNLPMMARVDDLFSANVQQTARVIRATLESGISLKSGDEVLIRRVPEGVVISKDICLVAHVEVPSIDLVHMLDAHDGLLAARVYECFDELSTVDIELDY